MCNALPPEPSEPAPLRILLVEDNLAANKGLARLLEARGFAVTTAADGTSALRELTSGTPPDFLLSDVQLPDLDGRDLAQHARRLVPPPRIVLITGWDLGPLPGEQALWGVDRVLTKPIDMQLLIEALTAPSRECQRG